MYVIYICYFINTWNILHLILTRNVQVSALDVNMPAPNLLPCLTYLGYVIGQAASNEIRFEQGTK